MNYVKYLVEEIHSVIMATVDDGGLPVTCAVDLMDCDEKGIYFLTATGKNFYKRLKKDSFVALTGIKGSDTMSSAAVSVRGKVREIGDAYLERIFEKNSYMNEIYPTENARRALTVFLLYEGSGEWFDLSTKPIERASFSIGSIAEKQSGYEITQKCDGCKACADVCPQNCIDFDKLPAVIKQENCLHCGNCLTACPCSAVIRR